MIEIYSKECICWVCCCGMLEFDVLFMLFVEEVFDLFSKE